MDKVGFIGLGRMGRGMASNLCRKGFELLVYDINAEPMLALERVGARRANGVAGARFAKRKSRERIDGSLTGVSARALSARLPTCR